MHSVFRIRDILDEICFWLGSGDLAATIRVNKTWSAASVGPLWKCVHLRDALKLLGPIALPGPTGSSEGLYTFSEDITLDNWSRFIYYAQYVRTLRAFGVDSGATLAAKTSRSRLLKGEPNHFFPNCQFLHYFATPKRLDPEDHLNALLPPTLDHIYLSGVFVGHIWFNNFCKVLVTELKSLRVFFVDPSLLVRQSTASESFDSLLTKFAATLTHVQIPKNLLTQVTIEKLSQMRNLSNLCLEGWHLFRELVLMSRPVTRNDRSGSFMSLKSLLFGVTMSTPPVLELFRPFPFPALTSISWHLRSVDFDIGPFLATIVRQCPSLEMLDLGVWGYREAQVPWSSVTPLLSCRNLVSLVLHCGCVDMTLHNLVELLQSRQAPLQWHRLEITTSRPFHFQDALLTVANFSPRINTLGLNVHDSDRDSVRPFGDTLSSIPNNVQAQLELIDQFRQAGFSFLSLSRLILMNDSGFKSGTARAIASLLLGICRSRVDIFGDDTDSLKEIVGHMAKFYEKTGKTYPRGHVD